MHANIKILCAYVFSWQFYDKTKTFTELIPVIAAWCKCTVWGYESN